jgi:hypothetical protein
MNVTGSSSQDPILGDPGYDTTNWQLMAPGPANFVPMQVPNAPIVGQINGALAGLNSPAYNNFPFGNNFSCYPIVGAASSSSFEGATCQNIGPGLGSSPSTGKYSTFTITLASPFLAARTVSGSTSADSALTIDLIGGSSVQILGSCTISLGGSNCSGNISAALQAGNVLGIALYTYNPLITQNAPGYTAETLPSLTVTVTP